jgi:hypothetical protein
MVLVKGRYYQHTVCINGRVTLQYYGKGEEARLLAADHALIRAALEIECREAKDLDDQQQEFYESARDRGTIMRGLVEIYLQASGYHRPQRRRWRRARRMGEMQAASAVDDNAIRAEMKALVKAIGAKRDVAAVDRLRALARDHPQAAAVAIYCNLPRHARDFLASSVMDRPQDERERHALVARMEMMAADLAGDSPSPAVRACAEAAAYEWVSHWLLMLSLSTRDAFRVEHPRTTMRRTASLKRLMYALKTVEQIKALERPVLVAAQVNIGSAHGR